MGTSHKQHGRIWVWFDHRIGLAELEELAKKKEVPVHRHTLWYYFGGMTLFLFLIQVTTGILLLFYYRPSAEEAYESVRFLMAEVEFGWLIRSIHAWAANLMIFTLFVHLFSVWLLKAYRPPRELTWLSGVVLMVLALGFGFTGYLLPWNELAYFATKVGSEIMGAIPLVGSSGRVAHGTASSTRFPVRQRRRPSPRNRRVGSHVQSFAACSAFTRVTACRLAAPPRGTSVSKAPTASLPPPPLRSLPAGATQVGRTGLAPAGKTLPYHGALLNIILL